MMLKYVIRFIECNSACSLPEIFFPLIVFYREIFVKELYHEPSQSATR